MCIWFFFPVFAIVKSYCEHSSICALMRYIHLGVNPVTLNCCLLLLVLQRCPTSVLLALFLHSCTRGREIVLFKMQQGYNSHFMTSIITETELKSLFSIWVILDSIKMNIDVYRKLRMGHLNSCSWNAMALSKITSFGRSELS